MRPWVHTSALEWRTRYLRYWAEEKCRSDGKETCSHMEALTPAVQQNVAVASLQNDSGAWRLLHRPVTELSLREGWYAHMTAGAESRAGCEMRVLSRGENGVHSPVHTGPRRVQSGVRPAAAGGWAATAPA